MDKNGVLTISEWYKGQTRHPVSGFGLIQNLEVFDFAGIAKPERALTNTNISVDTLPIAEVYDTYGNIYTATGAFASGKVYKNGTLLQSGLSSLVDLIIYRDYLWIRSANVINAYGPLNNAPQWFGNVVTGLDSQASPKFLTAQDGFIYATNGNSIAKLDVTSSGTPTVAPTVSANLTALDLIDGQYATTMEVHGNFIAIGTSTNPSYFSRNNQKGANIYTWNRQLGTLGNPGLASTCVQLNESGVNAMVQYNNKLYVQAGTDGNIYETDGVNFRLIKRIPYIEDGVEGAMTCYINSMTISNKGTLLVGVSVGSNYGYAGVYEIALTEGYPCVLKNVISTGRKNSTQGRVGIGFVRSYWNGTDGIRVGWQDVNTYGVDGQSFNKYQNTIIETRLFEVGRKDVKKTFQRIEFDLADKLVANQSIKISYRTTASGDYTEIGTWSFATIGDSMTYADNAPIADCEYIQLKIELIQGASITFPANIKLIKVSLW